jgi:predicted DNA-binding transcriptional regulator AlpA
MGGEPITRQAAPRGSGEGAVVNFPDSQDQPMAAHGTIEPEALLREQRPADSLVSIREIRRLFGLGRTAAYELTHRPGFPAPVPLSPRCYRWWASEVAAFAATLRTERLKSPSAQRRLSQRGSLPQESAPLRITGNVRLARSRRVPGDGASGRNGQTQISDPERDKPQSRGPVR